MTSAAPSARRFSGSPAEIGVALVGGLGLAALLVAVLRPGGDAAASPELTQTPPASATSSDFTGSVVPQVQPPPTVAAVPAASAEGLALHGVMSGAAIVAIADGRQMLVRVGRPIRPGVMLEGVDRTGAILSVNGQAMRLSLIDGASGSRLSTISPPASASAAAAPPVAAAGNPRAPKPRDLARTAAEFRQGLAPRAEGGQVTGFTIKPDASMVILERAGLRPGDVVIGVNGRAFASEDEVNGLAREASISPTLVFEYERGGKRQEARVDISE